MDNFWWKNNFEDSNLAWKIEEILDHEKFVDEHGRSSQCFKVRFYAGDKYWFSMNCLRLHDPIKVYMYGRQQGLLKEKHFEWTKDFGTAIEEYKFMLHCYKMVTMTGDFYKFGVLVPRTLKQALEYDEQNGNTKWQEAIRTEIDQINYYKTFRIIPDGVLLPGYKRIPYHIVFHVKVDGQFKARLVAGGH